MEGACAKIGWLAKRGSSGDWGVEAGKGGKKRVEGIFIRSWSAFMSVFAKRVALSDLVSKLFLLFPAALLFFSSFFPFVT